MTFRLFALVAAASIVAPAHARVVDAQRGSAIEPGFSLRHDVLHPGDDVTIQACVTNQNIHSTRDLQPGDRFVFTFQDGVVGACGGVTTFPDGAAPMATDFTCDSSAAEVALTYRGTPLAWPHGSGVCADIAYQAGSRSSSVLTRRVVGNEGAFTGPEPTALLLSVGSALQAVGPTGPQGETGATGPQGPGGPAGPTGPSAAGARLMAVSTGCVRAANCDPPVIVPGLDVSFTSAGGSNVAIWVDAAGYPLGCGLNPSLFRTEGELQLEFDGVVVARRGIENSSALAGTTTGRSTSLAWLSESLTGGLHDVRVLVKDTNGCTGSRPESQTAAIGSDTDDERQARLLVMELRD